MTDDRATAVAFSLGSNIGDRRLMLRRAIAALREVVTVGRISSLYETSPVDAPPGSPDFLNIAVTALSRLAPHELLGATQAIEASLGRRRSVRNASRPIDIDLVFSGSQLVRDADLVLPHPRFRERSFVLLPLSEIARGWIDPVTGRAVERLAGRGEARKIGSLY
jgi:2-amino-4-hydroxy-6-hydroxymethyldihydropteridine diphosphokinase